MAERRMFSKKIIDSDAFLDMPLSTQALYFHLSLRADDDGFINNAKRIQRAIGCSDDDIKLLIMKSFVIAFPDGICVIKHWRIHNYLRKDRYDETTYKEHKDALLVKKNGAYSLKSDEQEIGLVDQIATVGIPNGNQRLTQDRLGKDRIGKDKHSCANATQIISQFEQFWVAYPRKVDRSKAQNAFNKVKPDDDLFAVIMESLDKHKLCEQWQREGGRFIPYPATWLNNRRWESEVDAPKPKQEASYDLEQFEREALYAPVVYNRRGDNGD